MTDYPRVLIVGVSFNKKSGSGITLSNLFEGWPEDKIAVVSTIINNTKEKNYNCYQIGDSEEIRPWPFTFLKQKQKSGPVLFGEKVSLNRQLKEVEIKKPRSRIYLFLNNMFGKTIKFVGLYNLVYQLKVSNDLIKWIMEFDPDIIYAQTSELSMIRFIKIIQEKLRRPLIIHIMDDSIRTMNKPGILYYYWKKKTEEEFENLLNRSSLLMSICQGMSDEYKMRYNKVFIPFHNPVDIDTWLEHTKTNYSINKTFKLLYTGRIGVANVESVKIICKAVEKLYDSGMDIRLDIYTPDFKSSAAKELKNKKCIKISSNIPHSEIPDLLSSHDLLLLPLDFTKSGIKYAKVSMPTKASEYMISGTPILVYASDKTALYQYAKSMQWAYTIGEADIENLVDGIRDLYENQKKRERYGKTAVKVALKNHDAKTVTSKFRESILKAITPVQKKIFASLEN